MTNTTDAYGAFDRTGSDGKTDYLFRVSMKAVIIDKEDKILVVKESGRDWWDLPGGGLDHGESVRDALARELHEEVSMTGDFDYKVILVEDPVMLKRIRIWQMRITYIVEPQNWSFSPGEDGDETLFIDPNTFKDSEVMTERKIYEYWQIAKQRM